MQNWITLRKYEFFHFCIGDSNACTIVMCIHEAECYFQELTKCRVLTLFQKQISRTGQVEMTKHHNKTTWRNDETTNETSRRIELAIHRVDSEIRVPKRRNTETKRWVKHFVQDLPSYSAASDVIKCIVMFYKRGTRGNNFIRKK